jgi:hypothetical protein
MDRELVQGEQLPWQSTQENLAPERAKSLRELFQLIGRPAQPSEPHGRSPGYLTDSQGLEKSDTGL